MQARLITAQNFENAFQDFVWRKSDTEYLNMITARLLYASNDALTENGFLEGLARKHFKENTTTLEKSSLPLNSAKRN